jgi:hypothetical protein
VAWQPGSAAAGAAQGDGYAQDGQEPGAAGGLAWRKGEKEQGLGAWRRRTGSTLGDGVKGGFIWAQG